MLLIKEPVLRVVLVVLVKTSNVTRSYTNVTTDY